ncbi:MAG: GDP-mannose 4,6-dehydratase [Candidatus Aminicenantes bacterium]|nr:GDP-mannose 4,6-dehydratase [Candidatus Aminicenantes bacterium]
MAKRRIFITGATGFAGRHLMSVLTSSGNSVCGTTYPQPPHPDEKNIRHLDLRSEREVFEAVKSARPDWVFHLAAVSNVRQSWERKKETMETNVMGTFFLFEAIKKFAPGARILFISSSDVYGFLPGAEAAAARPFSEDDPFQLVSPYALSKFGGELMAGFYRRSEGLDVVIARPFPHTGPGQSPDFVCSDWARQIIQIERGSQEPVIRVGNADVLRDFTDVRDAVAAYVLLLEKGKAGEVYNVCSGTGTALRKILGVLLSSATKDVRVEQDPERLRKVDIPHLVGDNRKIRSETGWEPRIPLERTLADILDYWRIRP